MPAGHWNWTTPNPLLLLMADLQRTKKCSLSILLHKRLPHLPPKKHFTGTDTTRLSAFKALFLFTTTAELILEILQLSCQQKRRAQP